MRKNDYREFVHGLATHQTDMIFLNSDEDKMLAVFLEMFASSQSEFRIFAGNLCNDVTNSKEYIEAISNFIEKKGKLFILLNNFHQEKAVNCNLYKRLAYYQSLKDYDIKIKTTQTNITYNDKPAHFAIGDRKSFRIETDIQNRTAICNMNNPEYCAKLIDFFDKMFADKDNVVVDLVRIFKI